MDIETIIGTIALVLAAISLWQGRRSSDAISKRFDEFEIANERQASVNERLSTQSERQANQIDLLLQVVQMLIRRL